VARGARGARRLVARVRPARLDAAPLGGAALGVGQASGLERER
jgi:hypothetical protein